MKPRSLFRPHMSSDLSVDLGKSTNIAAELE